MDFFTFLSICVVLGFLKSIARYRYGIVRERERDATRFEERLSADLLSLRAELAQLRETTTQYDVSFDTALQRLEARMAHLEQRVDPDDMDRQAHRQDEDVLRRYTARYFPDAAGPTMSLKTCLFTNTPDEHFILDLHPSFPQVSIAAGFSGHGFKFAPVIGEILADLVTTGSTPYNIDLFRLSRFHQGTRTIPS